jgi:hypothetical protein
MNSRIRFITHRGKQILLVDLSHCPASEVEKVLREVPEVVTTRPLGSVLIFSDFTATTLDQDAMRVMKESAVFDKPYVKKSAWIGADSFPAGFSTSLKSFSGRQISAFENREEALAWLAED